jgi:serine protease Do
LTPQEQQAAHLKNGLVVEDAEGAAARAGIQEGDVLLAINGKSIDSVQQLRDVLKNKPKNIALLVQRGDETIFVPVQLG